MVKKEEMYLILIIKSLYSHTYLIKTKCMVMMSMKPVKLMVSGSGIQTIGLGQYGHLLNLRNSSPLTFEKNYKHAGDVNKTLQQK